MRCNLCGYDGAENLAGGSCVKCGSKLQDTDFTDVYQGNMNQYQPVDQQLKQTVVQQVGAFGMGYQPIGDPNADLKKTVIQGNTVAVQPDSGLNATVVQGSNGQWNDTPTVIENLKNALDNEETHQGANYKPVTINGKLQCPKCHYPISDDSLPSCPNCNCDFTGQEDDDDEDVDNDVTPDSTLAKKDEKVLISMESTVEKRDDKDIEVVLNECDNCHQMVSNEFKFCPYCGAEMRMKTVMGRRNKGNKKKDVDKSEKDEKKLVQLTCHLTMVPDDDEDKQAFTNKYEGKSIILNRANTEPDNPTITSKQQAEIIYDDGKWYIENRSQLSTTYLAVNHRLQISSGDVIMLGDRRFIFGIDEVK